MTNEDKKYLKETFLTKQEAREIFFTKEEADERFRAVNIRFDSLESRLDGLEESVGSIKYYGDRLLEATDKIYTFMEGMKQEWEMSSFRVRENTDKLTNHEERLRIMEEKS